MGPQNEAIQYAKPSVSMWRDSTYYPSVIQRGWEFLD